MTNTGRRDSTISNGNRDKAEGQRHTLVWYVLICQAKKRVEV